MSANGQISCVGCHAMAPTLTGSTTLMSKLGWRISRVLAPDGARDVAWRCPACWAAHKRDGEAAKKPSP